LANQEHQEGKTNDSTAPKALAVPQMLTPQPTTPEEPVAPPAPALIAKAEPKTSPLAKMMEEMDREAVRLEVNRLPLEIRKPGDLPPADTAATPTPPPATRKAIIPDAISPRKKQGNAEGSSSLTRTTEIKGTISNRGQNAVDAERTPQGIYKSAVQAALAQRWHKYHRLTRDAVTFGSLKVEFYVNREGEVQDLKIVSNPQDADARMTDFTLRAIRDAEIPPIPEEVLPLLDDERMKVEYEIIIYP
ncbi:MAG TPA: hypothetical protein VD994_14155, partial [Prosthecobacter sp.]|nr:hypothetical protein [Prosthecobacter sp.]